MEAIILAGGLGTRLRPVVDEVPKCLAPVGGKPFLQYLLSYLSRFGATHVVLSVGYLKESVIRFVQEREWPFEIDFAVEEEPLGTGGGIRLGLQQCREERVFVLNGDTFFDVDLRTLPFDGPVTLALKPLRNFERYGSVALDGTRVTGFLEKKPCGEGLVNGGVYALVPALLDLDSLPEKCSFEKDVLEPMARRGILSGRVCDSYFIDIGVPEDYARSQWELPELEAVLKASDTLLSLEADTLLLDRDGVVNRWLPGDYVDSWEKFTFLPGFLECLLEWAGKFRHIFIVSNQRGVGKGRMTQETLHAVHERMLEAIEAAGGRIDGIYVCTSLSEDDPDRKPQTGMYARIRRDYADVTPERTVMVGDAESDRQFARNCGIRFVLMETAETALRRAQDPAIAFATE